MDLSEDLLEFDWPETFIVVYRNGRSEVLLRGSGIAVSFPCDAPDGEGSFCADLPKKHPRNQKQCGRDVRFADLDSILDRNGNVLYRVPRET